MKIKFSVFILLLCASTLGFAQNPAFSFKRKIRGQVDQWHKIIVPEGVFKHANVDFSDLRILGITSNQDTVEAAYFLKVCKEELTEKKFAFKRINTVKNDKGYFYTFELENEVVLNDMHFDFKNQNFDFNVTVEGSQDQNEWFSILENSRMLSIHNALTDFSFTDVRFPEAKYKYIRVCAQTAVDPEFVAANLVHKEVIAGAYNKYKPVTITTEEDKKQKQTHITVTLNEPVSISRLMLTFRDEYNYYRPFIIQYLSDSVKTEKGWHYNYATLSSGTLTSFLPNEFTFNSTVVKKLKISIENQNNNPLHVEDIVVEGYVHELIARFTEPAQYALFYGDRNASIPAYDIAYFADKIPEDISTLTLEGEQVLEKLKPVVDKPLFENSVWLWAIMGVMIALIAYFSISMLKVKS